MRETIEKVLSEVNKVIIGKNDIVSKVFMAILASGHVLLEDVPGVGKTTMALAFARALDLQAKRIQFTVDTVPSDIVGLSIPDKETGEFIYKPGAIMTNILLADEINRTSSKTQAALLEAMEEQSVTIEGRTYPIPSPFIVLATQNPIGSAGTLMLPNSQMDRFMIRLSIGYPSFDSQVNILKDREMRNPMETITKVMNHEMLMQVIAEVNKVYMESSLYEYVTKLTEATRKHPQIKMGISPRGALSLCRISKAKAYLSGRDYVVPEDIISMASDVFGHRLILNTKAQFSETSAYDIIEDIFKQVPIPGLKELS